MSFLLASASPRRAELLASSGYRFDVLAADVDEIQRAGESAVAYVRRLAELKARAVDPGDPDLVVLAADTTVAIGGEVLGKPLDDEDAGRMLRLLSGREHTVHTGVAVRRASQLISEVATTRVRFLPLSDEDVAWYVATREPEGKAGAYAIQGRAARFIDWIEGSYSNVVGLPVHVVHRLLVRIGWHEDRRGQGVHDQ